MYDVARMNAYADVNLLSWFFVCIISPELGLNLLRALHSVDDGRKIDQKRVTDSFDDLAVMLNNCLLNYPVMGLQQPQHAGFVAAHLAAKADDVRKHDRRQPPSLRARYVAGVVLHGCGLFCWRCLAVNCAG